MFFKKKKKSLANEFVDSISPEAIDALTSENLKGKEKTFDVSLFRTDTNDLIMETKDLDMGTIVNELRNICTAKDANNFGVTVNELESEVESWINEFTTTGIGKTLVIGNFEQKISLSDNWLVANIDSL